MTERDTSNIQEDRCVICNVCFEDEVAKSHKGILTLITFTEKRDQLDLMAYLNEIINKTTKNLCWYLTNAEEFLMAMKHQQKDQEHLRRLGKVSADIQLCESMEALVNQEAFVSNERNCIAESSPES